MRSSISLFASLLLALTAVTLSRPAAAAAAPAFYAYSEMTGDTRVDIFVAWEDGTVKQLTRGGTSNYPALTPDSRSVAFIADGSLYRMNVDGSAKTRLFRLPGWECREPSFSAAGDHIVFAAYRAAGVADDEYLFRLYTIGANGGGATLLKEERVHGLDKMTSPLFSRDQKAIFYVNTGSGVGESQLMRFDIPKRTTTQIAGHGKQRDFHDIYLPAVSPDGTRIAAMSAARVRIERDRVRIDDSGQGIVVMGTDGTKQEIVYKGSPLYGPRWTRDGNSLLFETMSGIIVLNLTTKATRTVKLKR